MPGLYNMDEMLTMPQLANGQWKLAATPKKILVDSDSATDGELWSAGYVNTHPLNRNHADLVRFSCPNDADFQRVLDELIKLVDYSERNVWSFEWELLSLKNQFTGDFESHLLNMATLTRKESTVELSTCQDFIRSYYGGEGVMLFRNIIRALKSGLPYYGNAP